MAVVKDKKGNDCNPEYIFGIESRFVNIRIVDHELKTEPQGRYWWHAGKYKTQTAMLQALHDLRHNEVNRARKLPMLSTPDLHMIIVVYKPVHLYYDL